MHALAVLNFRDAAALDALSRAISADADYCLQSLANLGAPALSRLLAPPSLFFH